MQNKNIIVAVTGGIAAYKTAELVRRLCNLKAKVRVIMTKNAMEFITPLTMQTLSNHMVYTDMFKNIAETRLEHISLARWADAIIVAPASANFIARFAYGLADDLLTTVCLATTTPIAIAPAMNQEMWHATITQKNIAALKKRGVLIFGPSSGEQACGEIGLGRMIEPQEIINLLPKMFASQICYGKKIVITAGPTRENIDPVRYISNYSSGKMGYALAEAALEAGANVVLISGPTNLKISDCAKMKHIPVTSATSMHKAVMAEVIDCDIFIASAAVADYRPRNTQYQKIKKNTATITLELQRNPDILAKVASLPNPPFTVGFAAETENLLENAQEKLYNKNLAMIIANQIGKDTIFNNNENAVTILRKNVEPIELARTSKTKLAKQIIDIVIVAAKL